MAIRINEQEKIFHLQTKNTSYVFCVTDFNAVEHLYYGKRIEEVLQHDLAHQYGPGISGSPPGVIPPGCGKPVHQCLRECAVVLRFHAQAGEWCSVV